MKRTVKAAAGILCLSLFAAMAMGSGSSSDSGEDKSITAVSSGETTAPSSDAGTTEITAESTAESTTESTTAETATIGEQVLYDAGGITVTATGLEDGLFGTELTLLIENNSSQNITVQAENANVNGYMVSTLMSADVAAGKKANDSLTFETSGLKEAGIETIATIEFRLNIFDSDTWDDIVLTDPVTINTSAADTYTQTYDDSGTSLYENGGIRIIGKGLSTDDSFWGPGVILYIENNTEQDITVQVRDVSVNGFMVESSMSEHVVAGKKALSDVQFFSSDLEDNGITDITDVEFSFIIFDSDTYETLYESDAISISF